MKTSRRAKITKKRAEMSLKQRITLNKIERIKKMVEDVGNKLSKKDASNLTELLATYEEKVKSNPSDKELSQLSNKISGLGGKVTNFRSRIIE